jgi:hypothetical protein
MVGTNIGDTMEDFQDDDYKALLCHIDDLKEICEKLKVNLGLLEIPIHNATHPNVLTATADFMEESSSASSHSSSDDDLS